MLLRIVIFTLQVSVVAVAAALLDVNDFNVSDSDKSCAYLRPVSVHGDASVKLSIDKMDNSSANLSTGQVSLWAVRSSSCGEVWDYDIPPTPHTSTDIYMDTNSLELDLGNGIHEIKVYSVSNKNVSAGLIGVQYIHRCEDTETPGLLRRVHDKAISQAEDARNRQVKFDTIAATYQPLHKNLRNFSRSHLHPQLSAVLHGGVALTPSSLTALLDRKVWHFISKLKHYNSKIVNSTVMTNGLKIIIVHTILCI
jgi:hypothetical protein